MNGTQILQRDKTETDKHQLNLLISKLNESCSGEMMKEVCNYSKKFWGRDKRIQPTYKMIGYGEKKEVKTVSRDGITADHEKTFKIIKRLQHISMLIDD